MVLAGRVWRNLWSCLGGYGEVYGSAYEGMEKSMVLSGRCMEKSIVLAGRVWISLLSWPGGYR